MRSEVFHVVNVGLQECGKGQLYILKVVEERPTEPDEISIENRKKTVSESSRDYLLIKGAEVSQNQFEHLIGVYLFQIVLSDKCNLK